MLGVGGERMAGVLPGELSQRSRPEKINNERSQEDAERPRSDFGGTRRNDDFYHRMVGNKKGGSCEQRHPSERSQVLGSLVTVRMVLIGRQRRNPHHY